MSRAVIVRYTIRLDQAAENTRLVEAVFDELGRLGPEGLHYAVFRLDDEVSFVHVALVDGEDNPLAELPAFQAFQAELGARVEEGPLPQAARLVGSYRAFG